MTEIKRLANYFLLIVVLTISSICLYLIQYVVFHQPEEAFFLLLQDLAFVPVQAIIVTFVLDRLINLIEKHSKFKKINVIISAFFSDVGTTTLFAFSEFNQTDRVFSELLARSDLPNHHPKDVSKIIQKYDVQIEVTPENLNKLKDILVQKKSYFISMLENNNLLEHDSFTDMLWAVFHVADELQTRGNLGEITAEDRAHLSNDILRAYKMMILEWHNYIKYLKVEYPYLYTVAVRKNPFRDQEGSL